MAIRNLYLVRHGEFEHWDPRTPEDGKSLTRRGIHQASLVADRLAMVPVRFHAIYASKLRRAYETADIIARRVCGARVKRSDALRECIPPVLPHKAEEFAHVGRAQFAQSRAHANRAFEAFFKPAKKDDKDEILVCHGNLIRFLVCRVLGLPPEGWTEFATNHCGLTEVEIHSDGHMILCSYNDTGHLPVGVST